MSRKDEIMGTITILPETTKDPISLIGRRAGVCWGADISDKTKNYKRGLDCIESNHGRTLEFPEVHLLIDGFSAKCLREYYTHIGCLPTRLQASTRYIDYSKGNGFEYVTPYSINGNDKAKVLWDDLMKEINLNIKTLINECDIPIEDATMALPLTYCSKMVDKRNLRNLIDMSRQRMCSRAYWEFREMFSKILDSLKNYSEEWKYIVETQMKPKCEIFGYCTEKHSCGRKQNKSGKN